MSDDRLELEVQDARSGLYELALRVCDPKTRIDKDEKAVDSILDLLAKLRDASDASRYLQGGILARLRDDERWKAKFPNLPFWEFCEQKVGLQHRSVLQLMQIYDKATQLGLGFERLTKIGWTKAREFLRIATKDDLDAWVERADKLTRAELRAEVKKARAAKKGTKTADYHREDNPDLIATLSVRVTQEQRVNIESAIEEAAQIAAPGAKTPASRAAALDLIACEWRANHLPKDRSLEWGMRQLERAYGVRLTAIERDDMQHGGGPCGDEEQPQA